jgi:hypothetical protein
MPLDTVKTVNELTFRIPAGEYFVVVSQPYSMEYGLTAPYLVELSSVRVSSPAR